MTIESLVAQNLQTPWTTLYAWDISHALVTTYHPYCQSPSALTEYLKQRLRHQRAKCLGRSPSTQVEQHVPLECSNIHAQFQICIAENCLPEQLVFLDESACNCTTTKQQCAWSPIGTQARCHDYFVQGKMLRSSGTLGSTWAVWLWLRRFAHCTWSLRFRYLVRAAGLWA